LFNVPPSANGSGTISRAIIALLLALAAPAAAREIHGIELPESIRVDGHTLQLNGAGIRRRFFFDVYVIGLYVEQPTTERDAVFAASAPRQVRIQLIRSVSAEQMRTAVAEGFRRSAGAAMPTLEARLARLQAMLRAGGPGDVTTLTWIPGRGTVVTDDGHEVGTIEGKDCADVVFGVWIGPRPVDDGLARRLLAGGKAG
jgi:hypothetical protein